MLRFRVSLLLSAIHEGAPNSWVVNTALSEAAARLVRSAAGQVASAPEQAIAHALARTSVAVSCFLPRHPSRDFVGLIIVFNSHRCQVLPRQHWASMRQPWGRWCNDDKADDLDKHLYIHLVLHLHLEATYPDDRHDQHWRDVRPSYVFHFSFLRVND